MGLPSLPWAQMWGEKGKIPHSRDCREGNKGSCGSVLGSHCPEYRGDLLCIGHLPAMPGNISIPPVTSFPAGEGQSCFQSLWISPRTSRQGRVAVGKVSDLSQPLWQLCCSSDPSAQPVGPAPSPPRAFSPCKARRASPVGAEQVSCHPIPSAPGPAPPPLLVTPAGQRL